MRTSARAEHLRAEHLRRLQIGRHEDPGVEALARRLRGDGIGQVAGRRAAHHLESEGLGLRQSHGHHAILEGKRGEANRVIFQVEAPRRPTARQARALRPAASCPREVRLVAFGQRQQFRVAPEIGGARGNVLAREGARGPRPGRSSLPGEPDSLRRSSWAMAPFAMAFPAAQRKMFAHLVLRAALGPARPKKNASSGLGERGKIGNPTPSCPPRTGRELAPSDQKNTLVRLSWRRRARTPQPLCMKIAPREAARINNGIYGAEHSSSLNWCWPHGLMGAGRTGSWVLAARAQEDRSANPTPRLLFPSCSSMRLSPISSWDRQGCRAKGRGATFKPKSGRMSFGMESAPPHPSPHLFLQGYHSKRVARAPYEGCDLRCLTGN